VPGHPRLPARRPGGRAVARLRQCVLLAVRLLPRRGESGIVWWLIRIGLLPVARLRTVARLMPGRPFRRMGRLRPADALLVGALVVVLRLPRLVLPVLLVISLRWLLTVVLAVCHLWSPLPTARDARDALFRFWLTLLRGSGALGCFGLAARFPLFRTLLCGLGALGCFGLAACFLLHCPLARGFPGS
jgi:hypothetical protein